MLDFIATSPAKKSNPAPKTEEERIHQSALKSKEHKRLNNLKILRFDDTDKELVQKTKAYADAFVIALGLNGTISEDQILTALQQAHIASDGYYSVEHAKQWNTTFEFPAEAIAADAALLDSCGNDFTLMCQTKQSKLAHNRISVQRVLDTFGPQGTKIPGMMLPDFELLLEFARNGITPPVGADFVPQASNLPPLRQRYMTLKHTVNSLLFKQWGDGTMALLPTNEAQKIIGAHFSPQHQADSKGKQEGRVIGDLSGQHDPTYTPLNGTADSKDTLRAEIAAQWGEIRHPTVSQLVLMVLTAADVHGWDQLILWKKDLKGAFNLLNYNPAFCKLFAFPLSDGVTMIHMAGLFGWIGMPHAFQVLTRSLQALCTHIILGLCYWYVDDLMAVSPISSYLTDSTRVDSSVQHLLGEGSIAKQKSQCARQLEFLGWTFDLDMRTITLCERNLHKFLHALFCFDTGKKISIALIQRIASLASRTSLLNRHMRPYTHELHVITSGYSQPQIKIELTLQAQSDIIMWRSYVLLLVAQPINLSRSMGSFRPHSPQYCFKYDASLKRIAVGVYTADDEELLVFAAVDLPFAVNNEAKRQNTMEFLAIIFGLLLCWRTTKSNFYYNLHGDSMSSLAWAENDRVNSTLARRGNIVFTTLSMHLDATVAVATHIPGKLNIIYDGLSRLLTPSELGLDSSLEYDASADGQLLSFLELCDPDAALDTIESHMHLLRTCQHLLHA